MGETETKKQSQKPKIWYTMAASLILVPIGVVLLFISDAESPKNLILERFGPMVAVLLFVGSFCFNMVGYYRIKKSQGKRFKQVCTSLCAILSIFIIAGGVMLPTPIRTSPKKQWWICKHIIAQYIVNAIAEYAVKEGVDGDLPAKDDFDAIRIKSEDLDSRYFNQSKHNMFSFTVYSMVFSDNSI